MLRRAAVWGVRGRLAAVITGLVLAATAGGCGVSASSAPEDVGEALVANAPPGNDTVLNPAGPAKASNQEELVRYYLKAASGGGEAAINRLKEFLAGKALQGWSNPPDPQNPQLTVIRLIDGPVIGAQVGGRTPITFNYQVVGNLTEQGRIDEYNQQLPSPPQSIKFWVTAPDTSLRIDEIEGVPAGTLLLSDDALIENYKVQIIYFWDTANARLVPDLRYLPLSLSPTQRATKVVNWLIGGPSPWLSFAQPLPPNTANKGGVVSSEGKFVINLTAPALADSPDAVTRLYHQLQWSLRSGVTPSIELDFEEKRQSIRGDEDDYLDFNLTIGLNSVGQSKFDISDESKVVAVPATGAQPEVLKAQENQTVIFAAMDRGGSRVAFVRPEAKGNRVMQVVRLPGGKVDVAFPSDAKRTDLGRPLWIPGTDQLLVISGGRLWQVRADGRAFDVTPQWAPSVSGVSVSPDGRRVALISQGKAYVASLSVEGPQVKVGPGSRQILAGQFNGLPGATATAIAWTNEAWVYVLGKANGVSVLWRATSDSVVAQRLPEALRDLVPTDLVAFPTASAPARTSEVYLLTAQGTYRYVNSQTPEGEKRLFFVS